MKIIVDGKEAELKAGSSFEYVSENPLFTEAEDYTLEIEFPMKDCPKNIAIFGALHVKGVDISTVSFPCRIQTDSFNKSGILTITSVSDVMVKGQFLEGWSQMNYENMLPDLYISDMDFSSDDGTGGSSSVNAVNGTGWTDLKIWVKSKENWMDSRHIYLYHLIDLIFSKIGWSVEKSYLTAIPYFNSLIVVNAREHRSGEYRRLGYSLPRWTIKEFLNEIGKFFGCVVSIDSNNHRVSFIPMMNIRSIGSASRELDVLDGFEVEINTEESKWIGSKKYKLPTECNPGNVNTCPHALSLPITHVKWSDFKKNINYGIDGYSSEAATHTKGNDVSYLHNLALDEYNPSGKLALITSSENYYATEEHEQQGWPDRVVQFFEVINQYGGYTEGEELGIAPCVLDMNPVLYESQPDRWTPYYMIRSPQVEIPVDAEKPLEYGTALAAVVAAGTVNKEETYYKKIWLVLRDSSGRSDGEDLYTRQIEPLIRWTFHYAGDNYHLYTQSITQHPYTITPYGSEIQSYRDTMEVDESKLYRYKFLSKTLPDPKDIYVIKGKRYACLRLTAHFTVDGMSELIEGEFYEIVG